MDNINQPKHYANTKIETIDIIEDKLNKDGFEGFLAGNVLKYITRYKLKNGVEDLKKAQWYLNKLIDFKEPKLLDKIRSFTHGEFAEWYETDLNCDLCEVIVEKDDFIIYKIEDAYFYYEINENDAYYFFEVNLVKTDFTHWLNIDKNKFQFFIKKDI